MSRTGKIARLPREIRDELNHRLRNGEPASSLLPWLNGLPEAQTVLVRWFDGAPVSPHNLSEWRTGGFADWEIRQDILEQAADAAAEAGDLKGVSDGRLADHLATILAGRFASVLARWHGGDPGAEFNRNLRVLGQLCEHVVRLRRGDHNGTRLTLEQQREERARERTEAEVLEQFRQWAELPGVKKLLNKPLVNQEEAAREMCQLLGIRVDAPSWRQPSAVDPDTKAGSNGQPGCAPEPSPDTQAAAASTGPEQE